MKCPILLRWLLCVSAVLLQPGESLHLTGDWSSNDFFKFISKFGVQKTDLHYEKETLGYIFGNITSTSKTKGSVTLAVMGRDYFSEYYSNRVIEDKEEACRKMFSRVSSVLFDSSCYSEGVDLVRKVPCPPGKLCPEEDDPWQVIRDSQFTFLIKDLSEPRFWYVSLVACYRNENTCEWHHTTDNISIHYDIWLVNGNPNNSAYNPLVYQFSFDKQNTVELYFVFFLVYCVLVPLQLYAVSRQRHPVTRLFTASLLMEYLGLILNLINVIKFVVDGVGYTDLAVAGDILDILSRVSARTL